MIIAVLKETADYERRVALTPPAAQKLTADGTKICLLYTSDAADE